MKKPTVSRVVVTDGRAVDVLRYAARAPVATLLLAHGAGAGQRHPFLVAYASGLSARGFTVLTFDFLYTAEGRKLPDRAPLLEATWRAVLAAVRAKKPALPIFVGGKSMGGRIASHIAAEGAGPIAGLVFLGYPLHPPNKPDRPRADHLPKIAAPMLFCQGTRDPFGTAAELRPIATRCSTGSAILPVEGGDHSFAVPKKLGVAQDEVHARTLDAIAAWMRSRSGRR